MGKTHGKTPTPSRDEIIRQMTFRAAVRGYYDTGEEAQKTGMLTISVMDEALFSKLPPGVTHKFYVMINRTAYSVSRSGDNTYQVEPDMKHEPLAQEHSIREQVLEGALRYYGYPGLYQSKEAMIAVLLEDEGEEDAHPVITELEEGEESRELPEGWIPAIRSWDVTIGDSNCVIGMFEGEQQDGVYFHVVFS